MAPAALLSDVPGDYSGDLSWDIDITGCFVHVPVNHALINKEEDYSKPMVHEELPKCVLERQSYGDDDDHPIEKVDLRDKFAAYLLHDLYRWEPLGSHLTRQYYQSSAPPYFKRDHPDDESFLEKLGNAQVPWRSHVDEPLIKDVVALIIWQDTKHNDFWKKLRQMSPPDQDDSLYSHIIRGAASLVSFFYTQANLFKIGHELTLDKQMDIIFTEAEQWAERGTSIEEACQLLMQLTADEDEFSFVTENDLADMLCCYADDIPTCNFKRPPTIKVTFPPTDKDQLFDDITEVVRKAELSPAQLTADEYTHWIMTLLREEVSQVELRLISRAMGEHPMVRLARSSEETLFMDLLGLLQPLLVKAKMRIKRELFNVPQTLFTLCRLHRFKVCTEISETIQVAELRRMSLGSRFISKSHLIWAFYKLGYAFPLEIRNMINVFNLDEHHPPYHIYKLALKLALCSGEKMMQLDHFIYAILNSKDIDFDGERWTEFYQDFKDFQKALESMETETEPKSTVTLRPCSSLDIFSESRDDSHNTEERTTNIEPKSSENSSTYKGGAEESII